MSLAKLTHVWVEAPFFSDALDQLPAAVTIIQPPSPKDPPEATALPAQAILASSLVNYNGALLDKLPNLRLIQRTGIGYDNVVVPDATARKILVCNTPDGPTESTAEHTVAMLLATLMFPATSERSDRRLPTPATWSEVMAGAEPS